MKIAVIGSGGREHAIAWKLAQSLNQKNIFTIPGNGGIPNSVLLNIKDFNAIKNFCKDNGVKLIIVGPEIPLADGIVDYFVNTDISIFGPNKKSAMLETSKIWAKNFMKKYGVATSNFWTFNISENIDDAKELIKKMNGDLVIKYDGLAGGKGVYVCSSIDEAFSSLDDLTQKYGTSASFLIEEKLAGFELSILGFTDSKSIKLLTPSQDHKQIYDGDKGPNTGGMGAYCPVPLCNEDVMNSIIQHIVNPTLKGLQEENLDYKGVIYFGLMITNDGPKLLEYNVRLGDPEAEVVLPALKSDLLELVLSCLDGTLSNFNLEFNDGYFIDVVLASKGYPDKYSTGYEIKGLDKLSKDTLVFHSGTKFQDNKFFTSGGRVLNIVVRGDTLQSAIEKVYQECKLIEFENIYYRKDIGKRI